MKSDLYTLLRISGKFELQTEATMVTHILDASIFLVGD